MPEYTRSNKNFIIDKIDLKRLVDTAGAGRPYLQGIVALLWFFGCRPTEALLLRKRDILSTSGELTLRLPLIKKKKKGAWSGDTHDISFPIEDDNPLFTWFSRFLDSVRKDDTAPESFVFGCFRDRVKLYLVIRELGRNALGKDITPYNFRHSCFSTHMHQGDSDEQLMHLKGCHSPRSIDPYRHLRPKVLKAP